MLHNYKYKIHKAFLSSLRKGICVTVKETCVTVKETCVTIRKFWFIITTTNINLKHEVEHSTFNRAQKHSGC